ncbi:hypothetical protein TBLA_0H01660 [Henningerozyma blattae CBS 6284]|uniref:non-specific serine/threonine protein kinase n=1 Tax=Henningerozyma blattae (strain ATCC 34711 / CBS 6284 / DSM 70876 / NBRC 10599 / NRRL Y-10934 / UCD 77-7) TaxID=1071380 RepID=I2H7V1_HENB6|nr:hypothetical protein TBLA_0H01660 [Tetrapisispora blattae CBS 6284]CCH62453.1 hypothetical protein TBLA_0H01660 [Tetrapisispora blattae CBS 6284]
MVEKLYKRTKVIGKGKFGTVYKGHSIKSKKVFAIKVLNLDCDINEIQDIQNEIKFLSLLRYAPNITYYYHSYLINRKIWIIMEYCNGGSVRNLIKIGRFNEIYISVILRELLYALEYIHHDNIIHRDIKAANILINQNGGIKLCDFGIAAKLEFSKPKRQTMAGTPYWMAPEVIIESSLYDTKADIWSVGITAYEITTGNPPYCEYDATKAMQLITKLKPPRLEGKMYSKSLKEFIALCLDEDPSERLTSTKLLETEFIKEYQETPTKILIDLISKYNELIGREKELNPLTKKQSNSSSNSKEKYIENKILENSNSKSKKDGDIVKIVQQVIEEENTRWDFDSINSNELLFRDNKTPIYTNINTNPNTAANTPTSNNIFDEVAVKEHIEYPEDEPLYYNNMLDIGKKNNLINYNNMNKKFQNYRKTINENLTINLNTNTNNIYMSNNIKQSINMNPLSQPKFDNEFIKCTDIKPNCNSYATKMLLELFDDDINNGSGGNSNTNNNNYSSGQNNNNNNNINSINPDGNEYNDLMNPIEINGFNNSIIGMNFFDMEIDNKKEYQEFPLNFNSTDSIPDCRSRQDSVQLNLSSIEIEIPDELPVSLGTDMTPTNRTTFNPRVSRRGTIVDVTTATATTSNNNNSSSKLTSPTSNNFETRKSLPSIPPLPTSRRRYSTPSKNLFLINTNLSNTASPIKTNSISSLNSSSISSSNTPYIFNPNSKCNSPIIFTGKSSYSNSPLEIESTTNNINANNNNNRHGNCISEIYEKKIRNVTRLNKLNNGNYKIKRSSSITNDYMSCNKLQMPVPLTMKHMDSTNTSTTTTTKENMKLHINTSTSTINQFGVNTNISHNISMTPINQKPRNPTEPTKSSSNISMATTINTTTNVYDSYNCKMEPPMENLNMSFLHDFQLIHDLNDQGMRNQWVDQKTQLLNGLNGLLQQFDKSLHAMENTLINQLSDSPSTNSSISSLTPDITKCNTRNSTDIEFDTDTEVYLTPM